ncbi:MAG: hypothetical protein K9K67_03885 [Bacteriovoracaceae bacterium]|nr:hypothetical protein [Bacteriovoracaceae bacterium]
MNCVSYTNNNEGWVYHIPIHLQRLMIREYCTAKNLVVSFEHNELDSLFHLPILMNLVDCVEDLNLVFFSIQSLPKDSKILNDFLSLCRKKNITLHFANEGNLIGTQEDELEVIELLKFS